LINALHLPFELKGAYIGHVKVEGVVGFVAGSPLTIGVDNVCLVLGHKPVDWNNDLALRYAKELLLAILQRGRVSAPSADKQKQQKEKEAAASEPSFSVSPVKWILSKIQATIAETTVKLDRLHIRFEVRVVGSPCVHSGLTKLRATAERTRGPVGRLRSLHPGRDTYTRMPEADRINSSSVMKTDHSALHA
jgi:hypothetical protein